MPDFGNPFAGLATRKLTKPELIRAIRFMVAAEYEATQLYVQLAESIDDPLAQAVLNDIADEEKVHAGEFLSLLKTLAPDEEAWYQQGAQEVEEMKRALAGEAPVEAVENEADEPDKPDKADQSSFTVGNLIGQK